MASVVGVALAACATTGTGGQAATSANKSVKDEHEKSEEESEAEVTPGEDLMQEHGVLERILLIYDEGARRIESKEALDPTLIKSAAEILQRFVENYHEKNEEQFVFPRLQAAGREVELVTVLLRQHQRGREVTEEIVRQASSGASPELARALRGFARMYRPHAAREDTVLFPAFRAVVGRDGYRELGEQFEDKEHELFGEKGFENTVADVSKLEAALGIGDLARFTP
ncbi:MAG: hemerythrin domain-containing protein [Deltaproteobacteria bacterium]